jgi:hypothetical protein
MDPKLGERIQAKNIQMMTFIFAFAIFVIAAVAKLFHDWNLLHSWMVYIPLALGVAVGYFGQRWNERRIARIFDDGTRGVIEEIKEYISRTYEIDLKEDVRLETIRVGEKNKIRINPLSLSAVDRKISKRIRVAVVFSADYKTVIVRTLSNNEAFDEASKISNS